MVPAYRSGSPTACAGEGSIIALDGLGRAPGEGPSVARFKVSAGVVLVFFSLLSTV
jgi:hypothetical protein